MRTALRAAGLCLSLFAAAALAKPPKLTVFIAVDAFGSDVLWRMKPKLKGGLATLINNGAFYPTVRYEAAECVTAAGHATLATGAHPSRHGIVANRIFNRATGKLEPVFVDSGHPVLEAPIGVDDVSPIALMAETVSDKVKESTWGLGKAIALSGKARASIAMAGKLGEAWWFNEAVGRFVTGTYYRKEFPTWVKAFNDKKPAEAWFGKEWALLAPAKEYQGEDDRPYESDWYAMGRKFPHPLSGGLTAPGPTSYSALASSPYGAELLVQFAKAAIDGEGLGKDDVPDLLSVSFSSLDRVYHLYGPYSWEMQDAVLRLDKLLGDLIAAAEKAAGKGNVVFVLSADHGGAAIPEEWAQRGLDGVRVNPKALEEALEKELSARFNGGDLVLGLEETDVYLDQKAIDAKKLDAAAVRHAAATFLGKQPDVALAVAREDLDGFDPTTGLLKTLKLGYYPERSGDVLFVMRPYHVLEGEPAGTSHGTPYAYDNEVPLILYGRGVKPGLYATPIFAVDVAPTMATLMEMGNPARAAGGARGEAIVPVR